MTSELSVFAARLRELIPLWLEAAAPEPNYIGRAGTPLPAVGPHAVDGAHGVTVLRCEASARQARPTTRFMEIEPEAMLASNDAEFNGYALLLFALQFDRNEPYRKLCASRGVTPDSLTHWTQIPAMPTTAFKEYDVTCLPPEQRTSVFHSSGTTEQRPSRHFHSAESLEIYEASLWAWFVPHVAEDLRFTIYDLRLVVITPPPAQAPHSSLVHMFEVIRKRAGAPETVFYGKIGLHYNLGGARLPTSRLARPLAPPESQGVAVPKINADGVWNLDGPAVVNALRAGSEKPVVLLGTAFSFVHLLDYLEENHLRLKLPVGSRVMETGGYKGRSRTLPKAELHRLIADRLGVPESHIVCEYGMSEMSSQAYDFQGSRFKVQGSRLARIFRFPLWARAQVVSPETGLEVEEGGTGLLRIFDLANVFSVMAVQTEDLAVRCGNGFELVGRAIQAEPRGCSLMSVAG